MKKIKVMIAFLVIAVFASCAARQSISPVTGAAGESPADGRKMIQSARQMISCDDPAKAAAEVPAMIKQAGGYLSGETSYSDRKHFTLRVAPDKFEYALDLFKTLGEEDNRTISRQDVTDQVTDTEAVIENKKALRERYRQFAKQAKELDDMIKIEKELARLQSEIDSLEARLRNLNKNIDMSEINLIIAKKTNPGPVGWVFVGIWRVIEKLFVW